MTRLRPKKLFRKTALTAVVGFAATCATASAATQNDQTYFTVTAGALSFSSAPAMPTLSGVTLTGQAQTTNTTMTNFAIDDATGSGSGWNVTVNGRSGTGLSAVFKQYCNSASACNSGADPANSYVSGGATLPADSLTLNSTGASFSAQNGSTGNAPTLTCSSGCGVDHATANKVASASNSPVQGMGTWGTGSWGASSLALSTPTTLKVLPTSEVYRVDLLWTLNSGP
jgi:hypothetical protein